MAYPEIGGRILNQKPFKVGPETIEATMTSVYSGAITITTEILVGRLEYNQVSITESIPACPNSYVVYEVNVPGNVSAYDFSWRVPQGWTFVSTPAPNKIRLYSPSTTGAGGVLYVDIDDGCEVLTKSRTIWVDFCSNVMVKVYPNPTSDYITVDMQGLSPDAYAKGYEVKIFDRQQNLVKQVKSKKVKIRLENGFLPEGLYYIQIVTRTGCINKKLFVKK